MPTHKGIKLSLVSQWELKVHPEFPHPESSQFTYRSPDLRKLGHMQDWNHPSVTSDSKADRLLGRQSSVSVYTPSLSGARFWIRYAISEPAAVDSQWFYFKLFMNGRHITSWGTDVRTKPSGQVMRGLFEPSERWNYKNEGTVFKNMGTEARPFFFGNEEEEKSPADDGGLIEVLVFRARGRKRKLASPEEFRNQEVYGIVMPSGGLLDRPQDARFYDWHLKDPKDNPFAVFKFHYRSWENLYSLQLIPADHPRVLLQPSPSLLSLNDHSQKLQAKMEEDDENYDGVSEIDEEEETQTAAANHGDINPEPIVSEISNTPWLTTVFDDSPDGSATIQGKRSAFLLPYDPPSLHSDPRNVDIPISRFSSAAIDSPASPESPSPPSWQQILDRPLPEIPQRTSSRRHHSRNSSTVSRAPSVTPSLLQYLERDAASPEPTIGIAAVVAIPKTISRNTINSIEDYASISSADQYVDAPSDFSPPTSQTTSAKRQGIALKSSPLDKFFSLPNISNVTVRNHKHSPAKSLPRLSAATFSLQTHSYDNADVEIDHDATSSALYNMSTLSLSESEWMCRTPSPVRKDPQHERYGRLWSPNPGREGKKIRKDPEFERLWSPTHGGNGGLPEKQKSECSLRKKAMEWYDHVKAAREEDADTSLVEMDDDIKFRTGWI